MTLETRRRTLTRVVLVGLIVLATIALNGRHAEATGGYFDLMRDLQVIPASWADTVQWAKHATGVATVGTGSVSAAGATGTAIGVGTFAAAATAGAAVGGYVGWAIYEGDATPWSIDDPAPATFSTSPAIALEQHQDGPNTVTNSVALERVGGIDVASGEFTETNTWDSDLWVTLYCTRTEAMAADFANGGSIHPDDDRLIDASSGSRPYSYSGVSCDAAFPFAYQVRHHHQSSLGSDADYFYGYGEDQGESGDATRKIRTRGTCYTVATGATRTVTAWSDSYTTDEPEVPGVGCDPGEILTDVDVDRVMDPDTTDDPDLDLFDYETPDELVDPADQYAECWQDAADGDPCEIMVYRVDGSTRYDCNTYEGLCEEWTHDPDRETVYECRYGQYTPGDPDPTTSMPHVLPLSDCFMYERSFDHGSEGEVEEKTPDTPTEEAQDPAPDSNIFKAALRWAFVPSDSSMAEIEGLKDTLMSKAPVQYFANISAYFGYTQGQLVTQSCWELEADLTNAVLPSMGTHDVIDSCGSNAVYVQLRTWRPLMQSILYGFMFYSLGWWAWKKYAPGSEGSA